MNGNFGVISVSIMCLLKIRALTLNYCAIISAFYSFNAFVTLQKTILDFTKANAGRLSSNYYV